jgi:hypothetical protein
MISSLKSWGKLPCDRGEIIGGRYQLHATGDPRIIARLFEGGDDRHELPCARKVDRGGEGVDGFSGVLLGKGMSGFPRGPGRTGGA